MQDNDQAVVSSLWKERVEYVDPASPLQEKSPNSRELPLFMLGAAFYPRGYTFLNIFEMKYRTMMFDIAKNDDMFGYIHSDGGRIASVGTMCKVVDRQLLEDGRQYIALEGVSRFRVERISKTLPYIVADVACDIEDEEPANIVAAAQLEKDVYCALKFYMRIMKSYQPNVDMVVSQPTKQFRPTESNLADHERRTAFTFSLASMIQMTQAQESQLVLQTNCVLKRLEAEKTILQQASKLVAEQLVNKVVLTDGEVDSIRERAYFGPLEDDGDILPADEISEEVQPEKDEWDLQNME
jgi:ATP-dependent Lon protease